MIQNLIAEFLLLKPEQFGNTAIFILSITAITLYLTIMVIIVRDINKRYESQSVRMILVILALFTLPLFLFAYSALRKKHTIKEELEIKNDTNLHLIDVGAKECKNCECVNEKNSNYCFNCGKSLYQMCTHCSFKIQQDWSYCTNCGLNIAGEFDLEKIDRLIKGDKIVTALSHKIGYYGVIANNKDFDIQD